MLGKKSNYKQGLYKVKKLEKYVGDPKRCFYRSGWERILCIKFDKSPNVLKWGCEPFFIQYMCPITGKSRRYFPDFIVEYKNEQDPTKRTVLVIEVKPKQETRPPSKKGKKKSRQLTEAKTWNTNRAKWEAAAKYCQQRGWKFTIFTEDQIFKNKNGKRLAP